MLFDGNGKIEACYNEGNFLCHSADTTSSFGRVGGIAGTVLGSNSSTNIVYCYNAGDVQYLEYGMTGGIVGGNEDNSTWTSGGLEINYCYNLIDVSGKSSGGIIGGKKTNAEKTKINNCYAVEYGAICLNTSVPTTNSYYCYSSISSGTSVYDNSNYMKTQAFCDRLNSSDPENPKYKMIKEQKYPALYWQEGTPKE